MAVIITNMNKPKGCYECPMHGTDRAFIYCRLTNIFNPKLCPLKEVPTGKWNDYYTSQKGNDVFNCTLCSATFIVIQGNNKMNYCPNCGAKMAEEQQGEKHE